MFILIDFEATCWSKESLEGRIKTNNNENEIIEIGAALMRDDFHIISKFDEFVRPSFNPILSDFCKSLTSISQDDVDNALSFPDAWKKFEKKISLITDEKIEDLIFGSWGFYDHRQLKNDCGRHNIDFPFQYHFSIKHEFAKRRNVKPCGVIQALRMMNMSFEGTHHRAIDDIVNISRIFISEW